MFGREIVRGIVRGEKSLRERLEKCSGRGKCLERIRGEISSGKRGCPDPDYKSLRVSGCHKSCDDYDV